MYKQIDLTYATAWKITKDILWEMVMMRNAHVAVYL
jgi:hypothetical protein